MKSSLFSQALLLAATVALVLPLPASARDNRGGGSGGVISRGSAGGAVISRGGGGVRSAGNVGRGSGSFASRPANLSSRSVGGSYGLGGVVGGRNRPVATLGYGNRGNVARSYGNGSYLSGLNTNNRALASRSVGDSRTGIPRLSSGNQRLSDFRDRNGGNRFSRDGRDRDRRGDRNRYSRGRYYGGGYPYLYTSPYYYSSYPYYGSRYGSVYGSGYGVYDYNDYLDTSYGDYDADVTYDYQTSVVDVQRQLRREGYYRGPLDGDFGPGTRSAVRTYQRDHSLAVTGRIDVSLLRSLQLQ